jgi:predicted nucleic acid-binding protein
VSRIVLDASIALTWCFPDEKAQKAQEISERIATGDSVVVPAFWAHEILNALLVGEKRKRLTRELMRAFLEDLNRLPIEVDLPGTPPIVFGETQSVCRKHGLTAYDAAYLEIAIRSGCQLATGDDELRRAALAEGIEVL